MILAIFSISGFLLRAFWMLSGSPRLQQRATRIWPHVIDTAFLLSGVALVFVLRLQLIQNAWLLAKLAALVIYIVLGSIALKRGPTRAIRLTALVFSILAFSYIVGAAISKSPLSWLVIA